MTINNEVVVVIGPGSDELPSLGSSEEGSYYQNYIQ